MDAIPRRGRAAALNPPNRFERLHVERDAADHEVEERRSVETLFLREPAKTILARNESPDVPFTYSLNPYRGCEHGGSYCYARPSHEYWGFSAGLDFETRILVKEDAPALLARTFDRTSWKPQVVALSGNTDPYQPVERKLRITRGCLEVFLEYRNPVSIITKNHLVTRDLDLLAEMARMRLVHVTLSITSLDDDLIGAMEPRTSRPAKRLDAIAELHAAGIPVGVNVAPVIPGLTHGGGAAIWMRASRDGIRSSPSVETEPSPPRTPPVVVAPGMIMRTLVPRLAISRWTEAVAPCPRPTVTERPMALSGVAKSR